jgi:uncharacterized membrane protein required for colicin V production
MNALDWILVACLGIGLLVGIIRGAKAHSSKIEGDFAALLIAFFASIALNGLLVERIPSYYESMSNAFSALKSWAFFVIVLLYEAAFLAMMIPLFRFLFKRLGEKKGYSFLLSVLVYLGAAYLVGLLAIMIYSGKQSDVVDGAKLVKFLYPYDHGILSWMDDILMGFEV